MVTSTNPADASVGAAGTNQKITATFSAAMNSTTINPTDLYSDRTGRHPGCRHGDLFHHRHHRDLHAEQRAGGRHRLTPRLSPLPPPTWRAMRCRLTSYGPLRPATAPTPSLPQLVPPILSAAPIGVGIDASVNATFDKAMDPATLNPVTFTVTGPGSTVVTGQVTYDVPDSIVTFTPASPLAASTEFTATITGASGSGREFTAKLCVDLYYRCDSYRPVADRLGRGHQFRSVCRKPPLPMPVRQSSTAILV